MKLASTLVLLFALSACSGSTPTTGPHATVELRDGSSVSGMVLSSSPDEIKIAADGGVTRTTPMTQVRTVDYGDAPAAATAAPGSAPTMAAAKPSAARRPAARPAPRPTTDD